MTEAFRRVHRRFVSILFAVALLAAGSAVAAPYDFLSADLDVIGTELILVADDGLSAVRDAQLAEVSGGVLASDVSLVAGGIVGEIDTTVSATVAIEEVNGQAIVERQDWRHQATAGSVSGLASSVVFDLAEVIFSGDPIATRPFETPYTPYWIRLSTPMTVSVQIRGTFTLGSASVPIDVSFSDEATSLGAAGRVFFGYSESSQDPAGSGFRGVALGSIELDGVHYTPLLSLRADVGAAKQSRSAVAARGITRERSIDERELERSMSAFPPPERSRSPVWLPSLA